MTIEEQIINIGIEKEISIAKLYKPSLKAKEKPETGVTIVNKSAYHVIKDCATITSETLPAVVYLLLTKQDLEEKITKKQITGLVAKLDNTQSNILLECIINRVNEEHFYETETIKPKQNEEPLDDVYGDYGSDDYEQSNPTYTPITKTSKNLIAEIAAFYKAK